MSALPGDASIRVAILGCGFITRGYHLPALLRTEGVRVVALADKNPKRALGLAEMVPGDVWCGDPIEALTRADVDAVLIATPNDTHRDLALAAAAAGKAMLIQKPFGRTTRECREMIDAAHAAGVLIASSFMHRYFPEVRMVHEYLQRGLIGRLQSIHIRNGVSAGTWAAWFFSREQTGGGAAIDVGVHGIDLVRHWAGEIVSVRAQAARFLDERQLTIPDAAAPSSVHPDNEDNAAALYHLASGAIVTHEISWTEVARSKRFEAELRGDDGTILVRSGFGPLAVASRQLDNGNQWITPFVPYEPFGVRQHQAFADAVRGVSPLETPGEDGLAVVQVIEALYRSVEAGGGSASVQAP